MEWCIQTISSPLSPEETDRHLLLSFSHSPPPSLSSSPRAAAPPPHASLEDDRIVRLRSTTPVYAYVRVRARVYVCSRPESFSRHPLIKFTNRSSLFPSSLSALSRANRPPRDIDPPASSPFPYPPPWLAGIFRFSADLSQIPLRGISASFNLREQRIRKCDKRREQTAQAGILHSSGSV